MLLAWAVHALGVGDGLFHAAAFRYFWMTLGVFPAVALCVGRDAIRAWHDARAGRLLPALAVAFAALLALPAAVEAALRLRDTQSVQRESLAFVHRHFARTDAGFQPETALFCQAGRQTIRTHFSQKIHRRFAGPGREANTARMLRTFRETPIKFIVESFRLNQFPVELRRFWAENYQPYSASVFVAGRRLAGPLGGELAFAARIERAFAPRPELRALARPDSGLVSFDMRRIQAGSRLEVSTPNAVFLIEDPGYYRVEVGSSDTHFITRRGGEATLTTADGRTLSIFPSEDIVVTAGNPVRVATYAAPPPDAWDQWNDARSERTGESVSARYLPPDVYGAEELEHYGHWRVVETYGSVWIPDGVSAT